MDEVSYGDVKEMNLEKIWQESIRRKIEQAKSEKDKDYYYWLQDFVLWINCECDNCKRNKKQWI